MSWCQNLGRMAPGFAFLLPAAFFPLGSAHAAPSECAYIVSPRMADDLHSLVVDVTIGCTENMLPKDFAFAYGGEDYADWRRLDDGRLTYAARLGALASAASSADFTATPRGVMAPVDAVPEDVAEARRLINSRAAVLIKLEKPAAIEHLDELVEVTDAVMVARGDLGVELPPEKVPGLQKRIVKLCRQLGKPVVVATQMLDSMVHSPAPTRAEASDVATAVYDSADAVMLSAETAAGDYPIEAVEMMNRIIREVETHETYHAITAASHELPEATVSDAITLAARQVAETISAKCIVTYTTSGSTTLRASRERPSVPVLCVTSSERTARRLAMAWGVHAVHIDNEERFSAVVKRAVETAKSHEFAKSGDKIVITAGVPMGTPGSTNVLRIERVP